MPSWRMKGEWLKNCNCLAHCPCDTIGTPAPNDFCEGLVGMNIQEGNFGDVDLSGLKFVGVVRWPGAMHEGNGDLELYIDERATETQRDVLMQILTGKAGGPIFEILAAVCPNVKEPHVAPIEWEFDKEQRRARLAIPGYVETVTEPLMVIPTGEQQRVIVRLPDGFEYKEAEVARATTLKVDGAITFAWQNTHSSLSEVEQTSEGLVA
jgi:hypothetical protein